MADNTISTSIVVQFGSKEDDYHASLEVDDRPDGHNNGDTDFRAGDTVALLLYKSDNVTILTSESSAGDFIKQAGIEGVSIEDEYLVFTEEDEASSAKPIHGNFTYEWVGNSLGSLVVSGQSEVKASSKGVAIAKISYTTNVIKYVLNTPVQINGDINYQILCVVFAEVE